MSDNWFIQHPQIQRFIMDHESPEKILLVNHFTHFSAQYEILGEDSQFFYTRNVMGTEEQLDKQYWKISETYEISGLNRYWPVIS